MSSSHNRVKHGCQTLPCQNGHQIYLQYLPHLSKQAPGTCFGQLNANTRMIQHSCHCDSQHLASRGSNKPVISFSSPILFLHRQVAFTIGRQFLWITLFVEDPARCWHWPHVFKCGQKVFRNQIYRATSQPTKVALSSKTVAYLQGVADEREVAELISMLIIPDHFRFGSVTISHNTPREVSRFHV